MSSTTRIAPMRSRVPDGPPRWMHYGAGPIVVCALYAFVAGALVVALVVGPIVRRWPKSGPGASRADGG